MKHDKALKDAQRALDKLNAYSDGVFAAGSREETPKYRELNAKANEALRKLPRGLRSRAAIDLITPR